jgi:hypothetical protein
MNRKQFGLSTLAAAAVATIKTPALASSVINNNFKPEITPRHPGRNTFEHLTTNSLPAQLLVRDSLPFKALARYEKEEGVPAYFVHEHFDEECVDFKKCAQYNVNDIDFLMPTLPMSCWESEINTEVKFFTLLDAAVSPNNIIYHKNNRLTIEPINEAFDKIEYQSIKYKVPVNIMIMNSLRFADLRVIGNLVNGFQWENKREILMTGVFGYYQGVKIYINNLLPDNTVFVLGAPDWLGVMPIRQETESFGMSVANPSAVVKIKLEG